MVNTVTSESIWIFSHSKKYLNINSLDVRETLFKLNISLECVYWVWNDETIDGLWHCASLSLNEGCLHVISDLMPDSETNQWPIRQTDTMTATNAPRDRYMFERDFLIWNKCSIMSNVTCLPGIMLYGSYSSFWAWELCCHGISSWLLRW